MLLKDTFRGHSVKVGHWRSYLVFERKNSFVLYGSVISVRIYISGMSKSYSLEIFKFVQRNYDGVIHFTFAKRTGASKL